MGVVVYVWYDGHIDGAKDVGKTQSETHHHFEVLCRISCHDEPLHCEGRRSSHPDDSPEDVNHVNIAIRSKIEKDGNE